MRKPNSWITKTILVNLCAATLASGCGESSSAENPAPSNTTELECSGDPELLPTLADGSAVSGDDLGMPFVGGAVTSVNPDTGSTATLSVPEPGTLCMSGTLTEASRPYNGGVDMLLGLAAGADMATKVVSLFDAGALGIAALKFRLDPPAGGRMTLLADVVMKCECPEGPYGCVAGGRYTFSNAEHTAPVRFSEPTTVTAELADFLPHELEEPLAGTSRLAWFLVHLEPPEQAFDYEFCVSEVEFLDAQGNPVVPEE